MSQNVALITGASSGIGEAFAHRLAAKGHNVALVARRADRLEKLAADIEKESHVKAVAIAEDLTKKSGRKKVEDAVLDQGLNVDWLVNNAGFGTYGNFHELPVDHEVDEIRLNCEALVELTGRFLPAMVDEGRGTVINVASVAGFAPGPTMATYCATKAFVKSFSEAIASELRDTGVNVLCVCPGFTRTEFQEAAHVNPTQVPEFAWMTAEEVVDQAIDSVGKRTVLVNGVLNGVTASVVRLLPTGIAARVVGATMRGAGADH